MQSGWKVVVEYVDDPVPNPEHVTPSAVAVGNSSVKISIEGGYGLASPTAQAHYENVQ